ncbi:MAG TPA: plastocyanin/azurin family copper-binding protein [Actinomycetota bacterium]|nr:plastocyanin/azurin family copper-binding protein [Actinomycetota bacterium]
MRRWGMVLGALAAICLSTVACSSGSSSGGKVDVGLKEFSISPNAQSVKAGDVTFDVTNDGTTQHEMVLIRTDDAPADLPFENGEASETGSVGEVAELNAGASGTLNVDVKPGRYVMICNLPGHYTAGMRTEFTVS